MTKILFINMNIIQDFFIEHFNNPMLATLIIAMLPIFELRGAIPFGMSMVFWGNNALNLGTAFLMGFIGSNLVIPIVVLLFNPLLNWLKRRKMFKNLVESCEKRIRTKGKNISNKNTRLKKMMAIIAFVAVPLPLTGAYTGTMIGVMVGLKFYDIFISVGIGNLIAGIVIAIFSGISDNMSTIVLMMFLAILFIFIIISIIKLTINKIKNKYTQQPNV